MDNRRESASRGSTCDMCAVVPKRGVGGERVTPAPTSAVASHGDQRSLRGVFGPRPPFGRRSSRSSLRRAGFAVCHVPRQRVLGDGRALLRFPGGG